MKKLVLFVFIALLISGCSGSKINASVSLNITKSVNKVRISGQTNLPDQTELMISIKGDNGYFAQDTKTVSNGEFKSEEFSDKGSSLKPGNYTVEISTPSVNVQPPSVQKLLGVNGENLVGDLVVNDPIFGKMINYKESFSIEKTQDQEPSTSSYTNTINQPVYTAEELSRDPKAPSTNPADYDQNGQYVPHDGISKNPADYSINGEYKPVKSMTPEEIQAELEQILNDALGQ